MISIIVPHYCTKKELFDRCMQSLLKDRTADIEILVIDDGSPNEFRSQLDYYTYDKRVEIINEEHKGVSHARNVGIRAAKGEWVMFVDADDYFTDDYYSILNKTKENLYADLLFFNGYGVEKGKKEPNIFPLKENVDYASSFENKVFLMNSALSLGKCPKKCKCFFSLGAPYVKLIKTKLLREKGIEFQEDIRFAEDTLFSLNLILKSEHIYYMDRYLYNYYINDQSVTYRFRSGLSNDMNDFFVAAERFMYENELIDCLREAYYIRAFIEIKRCMKREFYHVENKSGYFDRYKAAMDFIKKEPYKTALRSRYPYMKSIPRIIESLLFRTGGFGAYVILYDFWKYIKDLGK